MFFYVWLQAAEMAASQEKQMEVCEVCGAFLIVGDAQQRIDDHLTGKQHVGFAKLRQAIQEIRDVSSLCQTFFCVMCVFLFLCWNI